MSEPHPTLQMAEIRARQALKKLHLAKCLLKEKFKKDSDTSVEEGSKVLSSNVSGVKQM